MSFLGLWALNYMRNCWSSFHQTIKVKQHDSITTKPYRDHESYTCLQAHLIQLPPVTIGIHRRVVLFDRLFTLRYLPSVRKTRGYYEMREPCRPNRTVHLIHPLQCPWSAADRRHFCFDLTREKPGESERDWHEMSTRKKVKRTCANSSRRGSKKWGRSRMDREAFIRRGTAGIVKFRKKNKLEKMLEKKSVLLLTFFAVSNTCGIYFPSGKGPKITINFHYSLAMAVRSVRLSISWASRSVRGCLLLG